MSRIAGVALRVVKAHLPSALQHRITSSPILAPLRRWYRADRAYWDAFYGRHEDPYGIATSPREQAKYARTLDMLAGRRYARALEIGCGEGLFSERLARRCDDLLAVDISTTAIERARARLGDRAGLRFERRTLPSEMPAGAFDLIIASDVLYCWTRQTLIGFIEQLPSHLTPGGTFIALHWRPNIGTAQNGDDVHDTLGKHMRLAHTLSETDDKYRVDRFERTGEI